MNFCVVVTCKSFDLRLVEGHPRKWLSTVFPRVPLLAKLEKRSISELLEILEVIGIAGNGAIVFRICSNHHSPTFDLLGYQNYTYV